MTDNAAMIAWLIIVAMLANLLMLVMFNTLTIVSSLMIDFGVGIGIGSIWRNSRGKA